MAWAYSTGTWATTSSINPIPAIGSTLLLGAAPTASDRIVVGTVVFRTTAPGAPTVTDDINAGSYIEDSFTTLTDGSNQVRVSQFSMGGVSASRPTIKVVSGTGANRGGFMVASYSGTSTANDGSAVDAAKSANGPINGWSTGASSATTAANELVVAFYGDSGWVTTLTKDAAYTLPGTGKHDADSDSFQGLMEYTDSGTSGTTQTATITSSAQSAWGMMLAVYKLAGAASTIPPGLGPSLQMQPAHTTLIGW